MQKLSLVDNDLTGTIPEEVGRLAFNHSLEAFASDGNRLSGTVPADLCTTELSFDCNELLCGCNCTCGDVDPDAGPVLGKHGRDLEWDSEVLDETKSTQS